MSARRKEEQAFGSAKAETQRELEAALDEGQKACGTVSGDYYVFALPVEQMAYYIQRSEMLQRKASSLLNVVALSDHVGWMSGIQFYLTEDLKITPGHITSSTPSGRSLRSSSPSSGPRWTSATAASVEVPGQGQIHPLRGHLRTGMFPAGTSTTRRHSVAHARRSRRRPGTSFSVG